MFSGPTSRTAGRSKEDDDEEDEITVLPISIPDSDRPF